MYVNQEYNPNVNILLNNGIYVFDAESATGKTWLCKQLKKLKAYGEPVDAITYNDLLTRVRLENVVKPQNKVIMLDRYDMYREAGYELINNCETTSIVLIDCKSGFNGSRDTEMCFIDISENNIEVSV